MKSRIFLFIAIVSMAGMLAMSGCNRDEEEEIVRNGRNGGRISGTLNGHDYVDLGLPSGTRWATCNVGATTPEGYGDYFAWGETTTKEFYLSSTYSFFGYRGDNFGEGLTRYCNIGYYGYGGYTDNLTTLDASDDAATANWGAGWRMPTQDEMQELVDNCDTAWTTQNGISGMLFTSRSNGNSIFLPAADNRIGSTLVIDGDLGDYWSSSLFTDYPMSALGLRFCSSYAFGFGDCSVFGLDRAEGATVRPVCGGTGVETSTFYSEPTGYVDGYGYVDLGLHSGTRWATCNVGATTPEGYGDYFAWGETTTKTIYDWSTYRYCNGSFNTLTKYCNDASSGYNGYTDNLTTLQSSDDAATANWGSGWRMPTEAEMEELINSCTVTWTLQNGVSGHLFTGPNGNSIFLPTAGLRDDFTNDGDDNLSLYWSSSLCMLYDSNYALGLYFYVGSGPSGFGMTPITRIVGQSVRPVCAQ